MTNIKQDMQQSRSPSSCRMRSACDSCHQSKIKCSGGNPCSGCHKLGARCNYSSSNRIGRPRGIKNKVTRQRLRAHVREAAGADGEPPASSLSSTPATSTSADSTASSSPCHLPTDINAPEWKGFHAHQMDALLMGCLDPSSADVDDASNATGFIYTANSSQYSLPPSVALPVPQRQPHRAFDFEDAHHLRSPLSSSRCRQPCASCDCLQQLAALFVQLKVHARRGGPLQAAVVISHVREGVSAWKRHLQCTACMESADSDTLLLCIVEIRMVLPMMEWISNNLDLSGQVAFSLQATPVSGSCQMPVAYELARGESQAIMRTLLLRSMDSVVDILAEIQERTSPMERPGGLPPAFELHTPQPSPSSLSSPGCSRIFSVLEPPGGTQGLFGQPLQSLLESAENLQKRIAME
ncbi:C6 finger domain protein GliZ, partial [Metarhizium majus ARSEF 297]